MDVRYLAAILVMLAMTMPAASQPSELPETSYNSSITSPPVIDMEISQNRSHVEWGYSHNGEFVNFTAGDELQVFAEKDRSENVSDPGNNETAPENSTGENPAQGPHRSYSRGDSSGSYSLESDNLSSDWSPDNNHSNDDSNTPNKNQKERERDRDIFSSLFPNIPYKGEEGVYQKITGKFSGSSSVLAALLAFGGLGAYIYRF